MADTTTQNAIFFWGTTAIIVLYTIIIMFVNVRINDPQLSNTSAHITRLSNVPIHPTHGCPLSQVQSAMTLRARTIPWRVST